MTIDLAPSTTIKLTYDQAFLHTLTLSYNNYKDWRLPTGKEFGDTRAIPPNSWYDSYHTDFYNRPDHFRYVTPVRSI